MRYSDFANIDHISSHRHRGLHHTDLSKDETYTPDIKVPNFEIPVPNRPEGTEPDTLVKMAKYDPSLSGVFCCYSDDEIVEFCNHYQSFRLPGLYSDRSLLLAVAHFLTLHTSINRNMASVMGRQATKPTPLYPIDEKATDWRLTSFGIEYQNLLKPFRAFCSQSWGI